MATSPIALMTFAIAIISLFCHTPSAISDEIINVAEKKLASLREKAADASNLGLIDINGADFEVFPTSVLSSLNQHALRLLKNSEIYHAWTTPLLLPRRLDSSLFWQLPAMRAAQPSYRILGENCRGAAREN